MQIRLFLFMISILMIGSSAFAEAVKPNARTRLNEYGEELVAAWQKYPVEKQKEPREAQIKIVVQAFNKDLLNAELSADITYNKAIATFLENLNKMRQLFTGDKMQAIGNCYVVACIALFNRETGVATDREPRTQQQCFDLLLKWLEEARDALRRVPSEAQLPAYGAINAVLTKLLAIATTPEKIDSVAQLDENLKKARRAFPITTPDMKKMNEPLLKYLETRAKEIQTKALKK
ncbi:MAG: hypothetical protein V1899_05945 [Planctomycetota bacterium]